MKEEIVVIEWYIRSEIRCIRHIMNRDEASDWTCSDLLWYIEFFRAI